MKINFLTPILDLKGKPIPNGETALTLGDVVITAMFATTPDDQSAPAHKKVKQFKLALLAEAGGEAEISSEDAAFLKERIGKVYNALVVGRAFELIEGGDINETAPDSGNGVRPLRPSPGPRSPSRPA